MRGYASIFAPALLPALCASCGPDLFASYPPVIDASGEIAGVRTEYIAYIEDPADELTLERVRGTPTAWRPLANETPTFGYSSSSYWLRFLLENRSDVERDVILLLNNEYIDHFDLYGIESSPNTKEEPVFHKSGGREHPFAARGLLHRKYAYPLTVPPRTRYDVYLHLRSRNSLNIPLFVLSRSDYEEMRGHENLRMGIYGGLFMLLLIVTTVVYFLLGQSSFLYYIGYLLFSFAYQFSLQGYAYKYLWPNHPVWAGMVNTLAFSAAAAMAALFAREFLETRTRHPRTNAALLVAACCWVLLPVGLCLVPAGTLEYIMAKALAPATIAIFYFSGWQAYVGGYRPARFYVLAWTAYLPFAFFYLLQVNGVVSNGITGVDMLENLAIGISLEMLIFPFAIGDRMRLALDEGEHFGRRNRAKQRSSSASRSSRLDHADVERRLHEALDVRKIYQNDIKLSELAGEIDLNEKDLSSYLNNVTGKSFYALINEYRVAEAKELLLEQPDEKIITIAHAVGFQSLSTFHSAFQKATGMSPREFRKQNGAGSA